MGAVIFYISDQISYLFFLLLPSGQQMKIPFFLVFHLLLFPCEFFSNCCSLIFVISQYEQEMASICEMMNTLNLMSLKHPYKLKHSLKTGMHIFVAEDCTVFSTNKLELVKMFSSVPETKFYLTSAWSSGFGSMWWWTLLKSLHLNVQNPNYGIKPHDCGYFFIYFFKSTNLLLLHFLSIPAALLLE